MSCCNVIFTLISLCVIYNVNGDKYYPCGPARPNNWTIKKYYSSLQRKVEKDPPKGDMLHVRLRELVQRNDRHKLTYDCVWKALYDLDEDETDPNNIIELYTQKSVRKTNQEGHIHNRVAQEFWWNREHVWAVSHGFAGPVNRAYRDLHHIFAANKDVNRERNNFDFANCDRKQCTDERFQGWEPYKASDPEFNKLVKGQVARAMFYMELRYTNRNVGGDNNLENYDLQLVNDWTTSRAVAAPNRDYARFGQKAQLLKWHCQSPPQTREILRNQKVYEWQGNRNPYIDHPEFVEQIYRIKC